MAPGRWLWLSPATVAGRTGLGALRAVGEQPRLAAHGERADRVLRQDVADVQITPLAVAD